MSEWTDLDAAADGYDDAVRELAGLRQRIAELEAKWKGHAAETVEMTRLYQEAQQDAERWQEIMLEWGYGVHNGMGEFWEEVAKRMSSEEKKKAIDAAMREGE